jgi:hypothetical protein
MESVGGAYGESEETSPAARTPLDESDENAVVDDTLERGESHELHSVLANKRSGEREGESTGGGRRASHSEMQRPDAGMRRRSHSSMQRPG